MYLSQLMLNLRSRTVRADLADRYELHRTLLNAFPETLQPDERVLYRVEASKSAAQISILVQSQYVPEWDAVQRLTHTDYLVSEPRIRRVNTYFHANTQLQFRLQANPTLKRDGKRHALYSDDALLGWLQRKGEQHGFRVDPLGVRVNKLGKMHGKKRQQTWHAVQFDGLLLIEDQTMFIEALKNGIGSAKAFGFGLLSVPYRNA